jgi:hypothetical protein
MTGQAGSYQLAQSVCYRQTRQRLLILDGLAETVSFGTTHFCAGRFEELSSLFAMCLRWADARLFENPADAFRHMDRCVWDVGGEEHATSKIEESLTAETSIDSSQTNVRRRATRAAKKCLSVDALLFLMLPFVTSPISQALWSQKEAGRGGGIEHDPQILSPVDRRRCNGHQIQLLILLTVISVQAGKG